MQLTCTPAQKHSDSVETNCYLEKADGRGGKELLEVLDFVY